MKQAIHNTKKGMYIYKLDEIHVCTLVETGPDSWELLCCSGKKYIGTYTKARRITEDFVTMLQLSFVRRPEMKSSHALLQERFEEFLSYRMVG